MDDVFGPPAVWVDVGRFDFQVVKGVGNFKNKVVNLVGRGAEVSFKSKVARSVAFHTDELEALWCHAGVYELKDVVVRDEFREWTVSFHIELSVEPGVLWLKERFRGFLFGGHLGELVWVGGGA